VPLIHVISTGAKRSGETLSGSCRCLFLNPCLP
jgi:hypothetical protein